MKSAKIILPTLLAISTLTGISVKATPPSMKNPIIEAEIPDSTNPAPRFTWGVSITTEGQWNMSNNHGAWANLIEAEITAALWQTALFEAGAISTYTLGKNATDVRQDFSNINATNRAFRLTHLGIEQYIGSSIRLFAGLRQADADYFNTEMAGLFTGASYGCLPIVNDNFNVNVYPVAALGVHAEWTPKENMTLKTSLYNGASSDRIDHQFRFRPHRDGLLNLGSITYTLPAAKDNELPANYVISYNIGNHRHAYQDRRHTQFGFYVTAEQPLFRMGRLRLCATGTGAMEFNDPQVAEGYWNAALALEHVTRRGGTLAFGLSRAYYSDGHETDLEATFVLPVNKYFSLQPTLHYLCTDGKRQVVGQLRLMAEF